MDTLFRQTENGSYEPVAAPVVMQTAAELAAAELTRRGAELGPESLKPLVLAYLAVHDHELLCVAYLDAGSRLVEFRLIEEGTQTQVSTNIREMVKAALTNTAVGIIMIHNHPGGIPLPSEGDKLAAGAVRVAMEIFDVRLLDAWVVAGKEIYSFREHDTNERIPPELRELAELLGIRRAKARE